MEKVPQKENSRETIAFLLIGIGLLWILKKTGAFQFFNFVPFREVFTPIRELFHHIGHFFFSWPMVLIVVGLALLAGKRSGGLVLLIIGAIFILPKIFVFSLGAILVFIPIVLIALGIALLTRIL